MDRPLWAVRKFAVGEAIRYGLRSPEGVIIGWYLTREQAQKSCDRLNAEKRG
jgi:hypothetical protein